jgi:hypothetical protein
VASYTRAFTICTLDSAAADKQITAVGFGRDWEAMEPSEQQFGFTGDIASQASWQYEGKFQFIKKLGCIAPIGSWPMGAMALTDWQAIRGKWRQTANACGLRNNFLHFYDARPNLISATPPAYGHLRSLGHYTRNLVWWLWHAGTNQGDSDPAMVQIIYLSDDGPDYAIVLPAYREDGGYVEEQLGRTSSYQAQPALWGRSQGGAWAEIAKIDNGPVPRLSNIGNEPCFQIMRTEFIDGHLLIHFAGTDESFVYTGPWTDGENRTVETVELGTPGHVELIVTGHTLLFSLTQIVYPASVELRPRAYFRVPENIGGGLPMVQTPNYHIVGLTPAGTALSVAAETNGGDGTRTRPVVTFTSDTTTRATLYNIQEYRTPTIGGQITGAQISTATRDDFKLLDLSGDQNDQWRGASFRATVADLSGLHNMADLKPNSKVQVSISTDHGANYYTHFTGYAVPPEKGRRGGEPGWINASIRAIDMIEGRLSRKQVLWQCSFEGNGRSSGWNIATAFTHLLNCQGVDDGLIDISSDVTAAVMGEQYYMPNGTLLGQRKLQFQPDTCIVNVLDEVVGSRVIPSAVTNGLSVPLCWGVKPDGHVFLRRSYEHAAGKYLKAETSRAAASDGWTFDGDTATVTNWAFEFRSTRSVEDFRNLIYVLVGEGLDATVQVLCDTTSFSNATARRFIGDLWTHFAFYPDGSSAYAIANSLWDELVRWNWLVSITADDRPAISAGDEIIVTNCSDTEVPDNSIFRIVNKSYAVNEQGRYSQTLDCIMVEEGA